jgi:hypothetical protein
MGNELNKLSSTLSCQAITQLRSFGKPITRRAKESSHRGKHDVANTFSHLKSALDFSMGRIAKSVIGVKAIHAVPKILNLWNSWTTKPVRTQWQARKNHIYALTTLPNQRRFPYHYRLSNERS